MADYDAAKLKAELTLDEGRRSRIYVDTVGKVSGGIGRNLTDKGFRDNEKPKHGSIAICRGGDRWIRYGSA